MIPLPPKPDPRGWCWSRRCCWYWSRPDCTSVRLVQAPNEQTLAVAAFRPVGNVRHLAGGYGRAAKLFRLNDPCWKVASGDR